MVVTRLVAFARLLWKSPVQRPGMALPQQSKGCFLLLLCALAFLGALFFAPQSVSARQHPSQARPAPIAAPFKPHKGTGTGGDETTPTLPTIPALCNPFDPNCFAQGIASWMASNILGAFKPITDFFQNTSANIITQTPAQDSYANDMIKKINEAFVRVVDAALACLLPIGGYNVILSHHLQMRQSSVTELLPRAILITCAAHFNLVFLGMFIDLENALCTTVVSATSYQTLTNIFTSFLSIDPLAGLLLVLLVIVLCVMVGLFFGLAGQATQVADQSWCRASAVAPQGSSAPTIQEPVTPEATSTIIDEESQCYLPSGLGAQVVHWAKAMADALYVNPSCGATRGGNCNDTWYTSAFPPQIIAYGQARCHTHNDCVDWANGSYQCVVCPRSLLPRLSNAFYQ